MRACFAQHIQPAHGEKGAATAAFLLMLLVAALPFSVPYVVAVEPISRFQPSISIDVQPNPAIIGTTVLVTATVTPPPPTPNDHFDALIFTITRPDGTHFMRGPFFSDSNGLLFTEYMPDLVGNYTVQLSYPEQFFASCNVTYLAAHSSIATLSVKPEVGARTWTVDDDSPADFRTVQEAIDAASSGDSVFVRSGTYQENLVVNKPLSLIGENADRTIITSKTTGKVVAVGVSRVTIAGFTIQGSGGTQPQPYNIGIYFASSSSFSNVSHNIFTGHGYAISLSGFCHTVESNYVANSGISGIYLNGSSNNAIMWNNVTGGKVGIFLAWPSSNNVLRDNVMTGNEMNFHIISYELGGFMNDVDTSNLVDGKPIYYWINRKTQAVPLNAGAVVLVNCSNMIVQDLALESNAHGILLAFTNSSIVQRNHITKCDNAIRVQLSANNTLVENDLYACGCGVALVNASRTTVRNNTITSSSRHAVFVFLSPENRFYHNHLNNRLQVTIDDLAAWHNTWDNGYPSGGNYWSDYNGTDANHDGIGDTPYVIDANNVDRFPLTTNLWVAAANKSENDNSSTLIPSEKPLDSQQATNGTNVDNLVGDVRPPQGEANDSEIAPAEMMPKSEPAPNLLTAFVVAGTLLVPVALSIYCVRKTRTKELAKFRDVANG